MKNDELDTMDGPALIAEVRRIQAAMNAILDNAMSAMGQCRYCGQDNEDEGHRDDCPVTILGIWGLCRAV